MTSQVCGGVRGAGDRPQGAAGVADLAQLRQREEGRPPHRGVRVGQEGGCLIYIYIYVYVCVS